MQHTRNCSTVSELLEKIEQLRNENRQLNHEMSQLKSVSNNILTLMTNYDFGFSRCQHPISSGQIKLFQNKKYIKLK